MFDARLLFDSPYGHPSYRLHSGASQDLALELARIWQSHCMIFLLILVMFARTTKVSSNVVQHIFLHKIDKCI
jgi:hypothetical protein